MNNPLTGTPYTDAELVELALDRALNDHAALPIGDPARKAMIIFRQHLKSLNVERSRSSSGRAPRS